MCAMIFYFSILLCHWIFTLKFEDYCHVWARVFESINLLHESVLTYCTRQGNFVSWELGGKFDKWLFTFSTGGEYPWWGSWLSLRCVVSLGVSEVCIRATFSMVTRGEPVFIEFLVYEVYLRQENTAFWGIFGYCNVFDCACSDAFCFVQRFTLD